MFRISTRAVNLLFKGVKSSQKLIVDKANCRAFVRLPDSFVSRLFYSKDIKQLKDVKSPLASLITKDTIPKVDSKEKEEEEEGKRSREQSWRNMKYTFVIFGASMTCAIIYLVAELGKPKLNSDGKIVPDEYSSMPLWKQYILRTLGELNYYGQLLKLPSREKLLPDLIKHPAYHPQYTLVLEFTDIIVHPDWTYNTGWRFKKRPGLDHFLETLSGTYEIVVYTAEQGMTVFPIIEALDPRNLINYKLVRDATLFIDGYHVKDLDKLNRDLRKVIVVDWDADSTKYNPDNVLCIPRWKGNDDDTTLITLTSFLLAISDSQISDVREVLRYYNQFEDPLFTFKEKQKKLIEKAEAAAEEERNIIANKSPVSRWRPNFFRKSF